MITQPTKTQAISVKQFPFQTYDKIRYGDTDRQGHVNNAAFSTYLETGRVEFLYNPDSPLTTANASFVIARLTLDFVAEIRWPGRVEIGTGITRIGKSSIQLKQALFQNVRLVATAETVIVQMDESTRKSTPLSAQTKTLLAQYQLDL